MNANRPSRAELDALVAAETSAGRDLTTLPVPEVDLRTLMAEMTALKQEIRAETRASRDTRAALEEAMSDQQERGIAEQALVRELEQARQEARRGQARTLIEVIDRLSRSHASAQELARPRWRWRRLRTCADPAAVALAEGLELTLRHMRERLLDLGASPIGEPGQRFDPVTMEALDTMEGAADNTVGEVVQRGYAMGDGQLLRPARVVVIRSGARALPSPPPSGEET